MPTHALKRIDFQVNSILRFKFLYIHSSLPNNEKNPDCF